MATGTFAIVVSIGGETISRTISRTGDHPNPYVVSLPAGKAGSLTTRTDDNTGVVTSTGHGLTDATNVDVYWSGGVRYGMTVSSYDANTITLDGGAGDNLPTQDTAVVVNSQVEINAVIDGDNVQVIGICVETTDQTVADAAHVDLQDSGTATIAAIELVTNIPWSWDSGSGQTNPLTGNPIAKCYASNGSSSTAGTLKILSLEDSTP